ncbi:hypothetical protein [Dolichospermum flos-aquae]|uniref:Uncharacterized protein n=1 Tax=Dolichospermum flos-aquae CCAP 1403/13F TaxID=315271 RepID=A0A6H2BV50_DOLFA|nr:hypothetical protein [Dolichospermum flos-aquae]QJB42846.1 hypothetical protein HGD76_12040 [Dolichospermum flos-aquae CCAP 1403/13F]
MIPTERFAIALRILKQRSHPHISKSDRIPHIPKSDSYGALRYRIPHILNKRSHPHISKQRFLRSASLSHSHIPKQRFLRSASLSHSQTPNSDLIPIPPNSDSCGALRYRTPKPQKRFLRSASLSHSPHPQKQPSDRNCIVFLYLLRFYTNNQIQFP